MAIAKKKKRFFEVEMPIINKTTNLQALEISQINNKYIKYDLSRLLKGKSIMIQMKVNVENEKAIATPIKIELMPYYLKRMVRKGTNYVEDSFSTQTKDAQIKIKPFLITRRKVPRAVRKALREKARQEIINYVKNKNTEKIFEEILRNKIQKELSLILKKIYPLSLCEIKTMKIEKNLDKKQEKQQNQENKEIQGKDI